MMAHTTKKYPIIQQMYFLIIILTFGRIVFGNADGQFEDHFVNTDDHEKTDIFYKTNRGKRMVETVSTDLLNNYDVNEIQFDEKHKKGEHSFETLRKGKTLDNSGTKIELKNDQINPTSSTSSLHLQNATNSNFARQNGNSDIQDIITGIVKLLNGNVNVHANTQPPLQRRPVVSRINNRGPPRINEAQPLPGEYISPPNRPISYPFERPDGPPIRPFFNGIAEQSVPTLQQNYRPNFISQNKPPWARPRPPVVDSKYPISAFPSTPFPPKKNVDLKPLTEMPSEQLPNEDQYYTTPNHTILDESEENNKEEIFSKMGNKKEELLKKKDKLKPSMMKEIDMIKTELFQETSTTLATGQITPSASTSTVIVPSFSIIESSIEDLLTTSNVPTTETPTLPYHTVLVSSSSSMSVPSSTRTTPSQPNPIKSSDPFKIRPGIVLDDTEFTHEHRKSQFVMKSTDDIITSPIQGDIFDVTLSAIQGLSDNQQTVQINLNENSIITGSEISSNKDEVVSIDGKKTYIPLAGSSVNNINGNSGLKSSYVPKSTEAPPEIKGMGYAVVEKETVLMPYHNQKTYYKTKPSYEQNSIRIDTCIVGDDSTCDLTQSEKCKIENGVSSCHCKPGYARRKDREPCRKIVSLLMSLRIDRIYDRKIIWDNSFANKKSDSYRQLSFESIRAIDSAMSMTPFSDDFLDAYINNIYNGDPTQGSGGVFVNLTLQLEENGETLRQSIKSDLQKHLLGVIHRRNNNIGKSVLYVESPPGSISTLQDLDECTSADLNDCHINAMCSNIWGSFLCECNKGLRDPWSDQPHRAGRECNPCPDNYCNNRGTCFYEENNQICSCIGSYYGAQCEIDGEVLGVAIGASVAAVIIILLTLVCLILWSRKWQKEQKEAIDGPMYGYMSGTQLKNPYMGQPPYQIVLDERMRWAHMVDAMAQSNNYGISTNNLSQNSSTLLTYPNLQGMGTLPIGDTMSHCGQLPPVPMPRYAFGLNRTSTIGAKTLKTSSSSDDEDDLLDHNFQVPRPRSRTNASITSQSGIYYDVDIELSGSNLYGTTQQNSSPKYQNQSIPMSTYSAAGRNSSSYYKN